MVHGMESIAIQATCVDIVTARACGGTSGREMNNDFTPKMNPSRKKHCCDTCERLHVNFDPHAKKRKATTVAEKTVSLGSTSMCPSSAGLGMLVEGTVCGCSADISPLVRTSEATLTDAYIYKTGQDELRKSSYLKFVR